jgi:hypothetical protein
VRKSVVRGDATIVRLEGARSRPRENGSAPRAVGAVVVVETGRHARPSDHAEAAITIGGVFAERSVTCA